VQLYNVRRAAEIMRDLDLIENHLVEAYHHLGETLETATERAAARIEDALTYMRSFTTHPHRGAEHCNIQPGIRTITHRNFIFYFEIDDPSAEVRILAVFFSSVDHRRQITDRLLS